MKTKKLFRMAALLLAIVGPMKGHALELMFWDYSDTYFGDCHVTVKSPSSAQGLVYVTHDLSDARIVAGKNPALQSAPGVTAQLKANLSSTSGYSVRLIAFPKPGYVLDGFVTEESYQAGKRSSDYFIKDVDLLKRSGDLVRLIPVDTLRDVKEDPIKQAGYRFTPKATSTVYAIFRPAKTETVSVSTPGTLKDAILKTATGDQIDGIVVRGAIDSMDVAYLYKLSKFNNLVRIDLSQARLTRLGNSAFSMCSKLYEVKLPTSGLKEIGNRAFFCCHSLKKPVIPASVTKQGDDIFYDCTTIKRNL
ncbi:MAG: leucine-rich repeat domain-containing protein [Prevotella sp.]|nr:leucine-rich repeat domain-containing protein [Prevotella sp.]